MPAYLGVIAHHNFVFEYAIVPDMDADHEQVVVSHLRNLVRVHAGMNCHLFPNDVSVPDDQTAELGILAHAKDLWLAPYGAVGKKVVVPANPDIPANRHVGFNDRTGTD
jgi:hypothetical protein